MDHIELVFGPMEERRNHMKIVEHEGRAVLANLGLPPKKRLFYVISLTLCTGQVLLFVSSTIALAI